MEGWIKISRDITNHWLWTDANRLKWWIDMILIAAWGDKQVLHDTHLFTLRRGQMIASVSFLSERWSRNRLTIIKFLKMLEDEGMIRREVLYRQTSIITICNYDSYQLQAEAMIDTIVDRQIDTIVDRQIDTIVDTIKENKEYSQHNSVRVCTRERETPSADDELLMMRFRLSPAQLADYRRLFDIEVTCKKIKHINEGDRSRHFFDWLRIQVNNKHINNTGISAARQTADVPEVKIGDYEQSF